MNKVQKPSNPEKINDFLGVVSPTTTFFSTIVFCESPSGRNRVRWTDDCRVCVCVPKNHLHCNVRNEFSSGQLYLPSLGSWTNKCHFCDHQNTILVGQTLERKLYPCTKMAYFIIKQKLQYIAPHTFRYDD
jgi:hypothetical protein